jgi:hypothetical protein
MAIAARVYVRGVHPRNLPHICGFFQGAFAMKSFLQRCGAQKFESLAIDG